MRNFNTEYASLSAPEKAKVKELLLNVAVEHYRIYHEV